MNDLLQAAARWLDAHAAYQQAQAEWVAPIQTAGCLVFSVIALGGLGLLCYGAIMAIRSIKEDK